MHGNVSWVEHACYLCLEGTGHFRIGRIVSPLSVFSQLNLEMRVVIVTLARDVKKSGSASKIS